MPKTGVLNNSSKNWIICAHDEAKRSCLAACARIQCTLIESGRMTSFGSGKQTWAINERHTLRLSFVTHRALLSVNRIICHPESAVHVMTVVVNQLQRRRARVRAAGGDCLRKGYSVCRRLLARHNGRAYLLHVPNTRLELNNGVEVRPGALEVARLGFIFEAVPGEESL